VALKAKTRPSSERRITPLTRSRTNVAIDPKAPNKLIEAAMRRNTRRLHAANSQDRRILGKYLHPDPASFFPDPVKGPDDAFDPPPWLLAEIKKIADTPVPTPTLPTLKFEVSDAAAQHNAQLLRDADYDFGALLLSQVGSTAGFGAEFRPVEQLRGLLGDHPGFLELAKVLTNGMDYRYHTNLSEEERSEEMLANLTRGNHKSAADEPEQVAKLLKKDVDHGFSMVIPREQVPLVKGSMVQPLGLAKQWTLDKKGNRIPKYRLTQDLSYTDCKLDAGRKLSVNSRIAMEEYPEMIYGWCLPRILHFIVSLRWFYPNRAILIAKYDYSDAYRRIAHSASAVAQTISTLGPLAYVYLRLTFGGSPNPPTWCNFSEIVTDLANEIAQCDEWVPETLQNPDQATTPEPIRDDPDIPFLPARMMAVEVPPTIAGRVDGFIDDLINVFLDTAENCARAPHVVPLAMHVTSRPHAGNESEPIIRRAILSLEKLLAEGSPAEKQIVLGWLLDTRRLLILLPDDKYEAWMESIDAVLEVNSCTKGELETLEGQLNHTAHVVPIARHFLTRVRHLTNSKPNKRSLVRVTDEVAHDLRLWKTILERANRGVSMNLVVTRQPTRLCWSDSCPFGVGGYRLVKGGAWRILIPSFSPIFGSNKVNNLLEFVGMAVNIWLECIDTEPGEFPCILALGDSTSAIGWLHSTSTLDPTWQAHKAHLMVARKVAGLILAHDCCLATQHIRGEMNIVADLLSFSGDITRAGGKKHPIAFDSPPNDVLTQRFHDHYSSQIPATFEIAQLPREILLWVTLVLQTAELSLTAKRKGPVKTGTAHGAAGEDSAKKPGTLTPSSLLYPHRNVTFVPSPSYNAIEPPNGLSTESLKETVRDSWLQALCGRPQAMWLRRFGTISNKAPFTSKGQPTCGPKSTSSVVPTKTSTLPPPSKKLSPPGSCDGCFSSQGSDCLSSTTALLRSSPN
jgi:hypothetical protein